VTPRRTALAAAFCLALTGCGINMPDSGPVHESTATGLSQEDQPASINPPGPKKGDTPEEIVRGFLYAMQATPPIKTSVAREFLTPEANAAWQPSGMVVYSSYTAPHGYREVTAAADGGTTEVVELLNADETDARGAWLGAASEPDSTVRFPLTLEDDGWRITQPPQHLLVPASWFDQRFKQVSLYFFDPSAQILVPEPVFVPRGGQFASTLVYGLLQRPSAELTEQSYLPPGLRSVVSVPVSGGVARIDLTSDSGDAVLPTSDQSELMVSQLAWTLSQDQTISGFRVSIDGRPVQIAGETQFGTDHGHEYAPYVAGSSTQLYGLLNGRMVGGSAQNLEIVTGPFGAGDYSLRTVSPDLRAENVAGVSATGSTLWLAPVKDTGVEPRALITTGEDLLRPVWDFTGRVWEVDRRASGAEVSYLHHGRMRTVDVPGISGEDVRAFLISRDGSRLVAVVRRDTDDDALVISRILTTGDGRVTRALPADDITDPTDLDGHIRDIAWRTPTSIVVLHPLSRELFQVRSVSVNGATDSFSVTIPDDVVGLTGTPVEGEPIYAFVRSVGANGAPARAALRDLAGSRVDEIDVDPGVTMLSYVS